MDTQELKSKMNWLNNYDQGVPSKLDYSEISLPEMLQTSAEDFPKNLALLFQGYRLNYSELQNMVDRFAASLVNFNVAKGDRVAILLPNIIPCVAAYYAILKIGAVVVMNCPLYSDRELLHQLKDSGAKVLVTLDLLGNRMIDLRPQTDIQQIIYTSIGDYLPFPKNFLFPLVAKKKKLAANVKEADNVYQWEKLIWSNEPLQSYMEIQLDDIAMIQYTGGTTGLAKGAKLSHRNLSRQVQQVATWFQEFEKGEELMLGALPFFHVFGLTTAMNLSVFKGWGNILVPRPDPGKLLKAIKDFKPTFGPLVPTMYIGMMNHPDLKKTDMTCFKGLFSGSAPLPVEVIHEFEERTGAIIVEGYGLTESSPVTHINPFRGIRKIGSIGIPLPDTHCKLVDVLDDEKDVVSGESGELLVKGPQVMQGYWENDPETAGTIKGGWLYTGDVATMDEDGYFFIVDRKKDMIISGGFNVYPREIDEVLFSHPKINEVSSVGIPHPTRGEQVKSFVVLKEGEIATEGEVIEFCRDKMATYKLPTKVEFRDELPKSLIGKILKKELRKTS